MMKKSSDQSGDIGSLVTTSGYAIKAKPAPETHNSRIVRISD